MIALKETSKTFWTRHDEGSEVPWAVLCMIPWSTGQCPLMFDYRECMEVSYMAMSNYVCTLIVLDQLE